MDKYVNSEATFHLMNLQQLGAEVHIVNSKMVYVEFVFEEDLKVAYVYNINKNGKYFLERIKPYPLPIKEFDHPSEILELIQFDFEQFAHVVKSHRKHILEKNQGTHDKPLDAIPSSNLRTFIDINRRLYHTMKELEDLFLYYRLPKGALDSIEDKIDDIESKIKSLASKCEKIYPNKDPENL